MNAEQLLTHYEQIADTPDAIPRLRRFVLDLAVRGKLVQQDASDEPASQILQRLAAEKARISRRKSSRSASIRSETEDDRLPSGWAALAANKIFLTRSGNSKLIKGRLHSAPAAGRFPGYSAAGQDVWLDSWEHEGTAIILSAVGARCGKAFLARGKWSAVANTHIVWVVETVTLPEFAMLHLNNEDFWVRSGGAQPFVKVGETLSRTFQLPPLAEQHRIVAKVDELLALCDRLEMAWVEREAVRNRLSAASLARLNTPDPETFSDDARFALDSLPALTARPDQIKQLRQTILNFAVRGKLVPQDSDDEPFSDLRAKIDRDRTEKIRSGAIRSREKLSSVGEDDRPFQLPPTWAWSRLGELGWTQTGTTPNRTKADYYGRHVPFIRPADILPDRVVYANEGLSELGMAESGRIAQAHSILMVCIGTIGKSQIIDRPCSFNQQINALSPFADLDPLYLLFAMQADFFQQAAWAASGRTTIAILNKGNWEKLPIPIPPVGEQRRVVAKVNKLMSVCDALECSLNDATTARTRLLEATLAAALTPAPAELHEAAE